MAPKPEKAAPAPVVSAKPVPAPVMATAAVVAPGDEPHPDTPEPPAPYAQELIDALPDGLKPIETVAPVIDALDFSPSTDPVMSTDGVAPSTVGISTGGASDPDVEAEADEIIAESNASLIAMSHPDNGSCDLYGVDASGNHMVPVADAATMIDHGFVVVATKAKS